MDLSNADLVKALRCCARYAYNCEGCVALPVCDAQDYFGVELIAADRIEQLEIDLEVCRQNIGDLRKELQEKEESIEFLLTKVGVNK